MYSVINIKNVCTFTPLSLEIQVYFNGIWFYVSIFVLYKTIVFYDHIKEIWKTLCKQMWK